MRISDWSSDVCSSDLPVLATTSGRGASLGRNNGVRALPEGDFVVNFPNDNTVFPPDTVSQLRAAVGDPEFPAGGFTSWAERGPKTNLPPAAPPLDRSNVRWAIDMGHPMHRSSFDPLGGC